MTPTSSPSRSTTGLPAHPGVEINPHRAPPFAPPVIAASPVPGDSAPNSRLRESIDDLGESLQPRHGALAQRGADRRPRSDRIGPDRASGEEPGGAATAGGFDRVRKSLQRDAGREHYPRHVDRLGDLLAPPRRLLERRLAEAGDLRLVDVGTARRELARGFEEQIVVVTARHPFDDREQL